MAEYIKREDAVKIIEEKQKELCPVGRYGRNYVYGSDREKYDAWEEIIDALENLPAVGVAEVVRCKDCRYYQDAKINKKGFLICPASGMEITEMDYCSYGARMDEEDEHDKDPSDPV
jgi:hypothetical protein